MCLEQGSPVSVRFLSNLSSSGCLPLTQQVNSFLFYCLWVMTVFPRSGLQSHKRASLSFPIFKIVILRRKKNINLLNGFKPSVSAENKVSNRNNKTILITSSISWMNFCVLWTWISITNFHCSPCLTVVFQMPLDLIAAGIID